MKRKDIFLIFMAGMLCMASNTTLGNTILYVDDDAPIGGNGLSWETAYRYLQDGLGVAAAMVEQEEDEEDPGSGGRSGRSGRSTGFDTDPCSVEVWVAQGRYVPDCNEAWPEGSGDRGAAFALVSGMILKGGYAGLTGTEPNVCDPELHRTVLSGDLAGDDLLVSDPCDLEPLEGEQVGCVPRGWCFEPTRWSLMLESTRRENSRHVITTSGAGQDLSLTGVMITGGNAYVTFTRFGGVVSYDEEEIGGGILNQAQSLILQDCILAHNSCFGVGGGLCSAEDCNLVLEGCRFVENYSEESGGGIYCAGNGEIVLTRCGFDRNVTDGGDGIAIFSSAKEMQLQECTFVGNTDYDQGEPIIDFSGDSLDLDHCVFRDNLGSGVSCSQAEAIFKDCLFQNNTSSSGGALYLRRSDVSIGDCLFVNNRADHGGAIYASGNSADISNVIFLKNSIFSGNHASNDGGALNSKAIATVIENCTFSDNRSNLEGGALVCTIGVELTTTNSIFEGNFSPAGMNAYIGQSYLGTHPSSMSVQYCLIEAGQESVTMDSNCTLAWGEGNFDADPCFIDSGYWDANGTLTDVNDDYFVAGDYHLKSQAGHWNPYRGEWTLDDVTSPCIDAGDPNTPVGLEPSPNGGRINMGAYGGTSEASMSYSDGLSCSESIYWADCLELACIASHWLDQRVD